MKLPDSEKYSLSQQLRRAATSVTLNLAEGCSRKSLVERKRYFEIARGSIVEIDSIFDLLSDLSYCSLTELEATGELIVRTFKMLSSMMHSA